MYGRDVLSGSPHLRDPTNIALLSFPCSDEEDGACDLLLKATRDQLREKEKDYEEVEKQRSEVERQKFDVESELFDTKRRAISLQRRLNVKESDYQK